MLLLLSQISFLKMCCFSKLVLSFRELGSPAEAGLRGLGLIFPLRSPGSLSPCAQQRHVPGARGPGAGVRSPSPVYPLSCRGGLGAALLRDLQSWGGVAEATRLSDLGPRNAGASGAQVQEEREAGSETPRLVNGGGWGGCEEAVLVMARGAGRECGRTVQAPGLPREGPRPSLQTPATEQAEPEQPQGLGGAWLFRSWKSAAFGGAGIRVPGRPRPETRDRRAGGKGAPGVREGKMSRGWPGLCGVPGSRLPGQGAPPPPRFLAR